MSQSHTRESVCVVLAAAEGDEAGACMESLQAHTPTTTTILRVEPTSAAVNRALELVSPADVIVLDEPCEVSEGWLGRLHDAALEDTNTATASALADAGTDLALWHHEDAPEDFAALTEHLQAHTLKLRPRMTRAVGPCLYVRRETLELVGKLDEELALADALEIDLAQRALLSGLAHVAADDVLVQRLTPVRRSLLPTTERELPPSLLDRYPYLAESTILAESSVLKYALAAARGPEQRPWVTLDARALDGALTGTQVHILELILALARTGELRLRLLIWAERIDKATLELLRRLSGVEILAAEEVDSTTPRTTVFHRPQQAFSPGDISLALTLGERVVLSQLDLIAYRNVGYFADAASWREYRRASRRGMSVAERVVVFSEHTRRELLSDALVEPERVRVIPPGLDHRPPGEPRRPGALEGDEVLTEGFLLCLGTDFRHKNRVFALRLLGALRDDHGWRGRLVLAGTHIAHGSSRELERGLLGERPQLRNAVIDLGSVSEQEKAWLLAHTSAMVYPSVYEGFGLVPFESALQGVPCVFAAQSSLAEAAPAGTATIFPWDEAQSAAAVHTLLSDDAARARHVQALAGAARKLTWERTAASMIEVYREAAAATMREAATVSRDAAEREGALIATHEGDVQRLIDERELVLGDYNQLIEELGPGRGLIGPQGSLPENVQRALLALSARPALSQALFSALSRVFIAARALDRVLLRRLRGTR